MHNKKSMLICFILAVIIYGAIGCSVAVYDNYKHSKNTTTLVEDKIVGFTEEPILLAAKTIELNNNPVLFKDLKYAAVYDLNFYSTLLADAEDGLLQLNTAISSGDYTLEAEEVMMKEATRLTTLMKDVETTISNIERWEKDFYCAAKVFEFFTKRGYSKEVTCAILGNMMIETSGGSLSLNPCIYDPTGEYYGLCQWSLYYNPGIVDLSFKGQLDYLDHSMPDEFRVFGRCYKQGFTYHDFLAMKDPAEAALAFAQVYERCATFSYELRMDAALKAYEYFDLEAASTK